MSYTKDVSKWIPTEDELKEIKFLASLGLSEKQVASKLNMHHDAFRWARMNIESVQESMDQGLTETIQKCVVKLIEKIDEGNLSAIMFFLQKRGGWGDEITLTPKKASGSFSLRKIS